MESIGTLAATALERIQESERLPSSPSNLPAAQAKRDHDGLPVLFDRQCDLEIPDAVVSDRDIAGNVRALRRDLTIVERAVIEARAAALHDALAPFARSERDQLSADLAAMLSGFRFMRQADEAADSMLEVTLAVLRDFPAWAISRACAQMIRSRAERRFPPNDTEIFDAAREEVRLHRKWLAQAQRLLEAPAETRRPLSDACPTAVGHPPSGQLAPIKPWPPSPDVLAELEARKARNAARQ
jgi:hypothetical protein